MIEQRLVTTILFFSLRRGIQTNFDEKKEKEKENKYGIKYYRLFNRF